MSQLAFVCQKHWLGIGGSGSLVGKVLTQIVRDLGLSSTWFQFFSATSYRCWKKIYISYNDNIWETSISNNKDAYKGTRSVSFIYDK